MKAKIVKRVLVGLMATASLVLLAMTGFSVRTSISNGVWTQERTLEQQVATQMEEFKTPFDPDVFTEVKRSNLPRPSIAALFVLPASECGPSLIEVDAYARLLRERSGDDIDIHLQAAIIAEDRSRAERYIRLVNLQMPAHPFGKVRGKIGFDEPHIVFIDMSSYMSTYRISLFRSKTTEEYKNVVLDLVFSHHTSNHFS